MSAAWRTLVAAGGALVVGVGAADAQLLGAAPSTDTTSFGDRFELRVEVVVPVGVVLYVPEAAPETEVASGVDRVRWSVERTPDGSAAVSLVYDVVAYQVGIVPVPGLTLYLGPPAGRRSPGEEPDAVSILPEDDPGSAAAGSQPLRVPSRTVWVRSVLGGEDAEGGLAPRPADDVFGASWNAPAVASTLAFASLLLLVAFVSGREWLTARAHGRRPDPLSIAKREALDALDALLDEHLGGTADDVERLFERSSTIVRRYVEHLDRRWTAAFTSTELMRSLGARLGEKEGPHGVGGPESGGRVEGLILQMGVAEVVKFGRLRPDVAAAGDHVRTLRAWIETS